MLAQRAYLAIGKADIAGIDRIEILAIAGRLKAILHLAIELEDNRQPLARCRILEKREKGYFPFLLKIPSLVGLHSTEV